MHKSLKLGAIEWKAILATLKISREDPAVQFYRVNYF